MRQWHEKLSEVRGFGVIYRALVVLVGFILVILGTVMILLPGPGLLTIFLGLALMATEIPWAQRFLDYLKTKTQQTMQTMKSKFKK